LAAIGFRTSLWIVAGGLALHGAFDFVRHSFLTAPGAPEWWPAFCGAYDVVAALGLATLLSIERRSGALSNGRDDLGTATVGNSSNADSN
jgi:hypothetical protein